jgi:SHS family sialic acid transporter-like MFS transporter
MPATDAAPGTLTPELPWYRAISVQCWRVVFAAWAAWAIDAVDFLGITFVMTDIARQFNVSLSTSSLLLFATYGMRWFGGLLFGSLSDRIGRKIPLLIAIAWFTLCAVLTGVAWSFTAIMAFRILLGFGMAPGYSIGTTLIAETWPDKYRSIAIGIQATGFGVGGLGAALAYGVVYPYFGWRAIFFVGIVPAILLGLFIVFLVDESPVWKAGAAKRAAGDIPAITLFRRYPGRVSFLCILMLVLFLSDWPILGLFPSYLKSLNLSTAYVASLTATASVGQIVGYLCAGVIAQRFGRKNGTIFMLGVGAVFVFVLVFEIHNFMLAEMASFVSGALLVGAAAIRGTMLTENLPTEVRASGFGFVYNFGSFGGGLAPFFVLSAIQYFDMGFGSGLAVSTAIAVAFAIVVVLFARETRGVALADAGGSSRPKGAGGPR